ncbi:uncharacterized protein LOC144332655 [Macaca mulatta]
MVASESLPVSSSRSGSSSPGRSSQALRWLPGALPGSSHCRLKVPPRRSGRRVPVRGAPRSRSRGRGRGRRQLGGSGRPRLSALGRLQDPGFPRARVRERGWGAGPTPARPASCGQQLAACGREPAGRVVGGARCRGGGGAANPRGGRRPLIPPRGPAACTRLPPPAPTRTSRTAAQSGKEAGVHTRGPDSRPRVKTPQPTRLPITCLPPAPSRAVTGSRKAKGDTPNH